MVRRSVLSLLALCGPTVLLPAQERVRVPEAAAGTERGASDGGPGTVWARYEIDELEPALRGVSSSFGRTAAGLGDLDGDGVSDLAVGSDTFLWVLFMAADGTVREHAPPIPTLDSVGILRQAYSLACLGDLSGDGTVELAYSLGNGVVILSLDGGGEVVGEVHIGEGQGGIDLGTDLEAFGLSRLGDFDGDGVEDLVVGDPRHGGAPNVGDGRAWIFFLAPDGTVDRHTAIDPADVGLAPGLRFGETVAGLGDLDGDGVGDLAVLTLDGFERLNVIFLNPDGSVKSFRRSPFPPMASLTEIGDLDGDGVVDLLAGRGEYGDANGDAEELFVVFLRADGSIKGHQRIGIGVGGFQGAVELGDDLGSSLAYLGDLSSDGTIEIAAGANSDERGAAWVLSLRSDGTIQGHQKIEPGSGAAPPAGGIEFGDDFGASLASVGDLDGDGTPELAVGDTDKDIVRVMFMRPDGSVAAMQLLGFESIEPGTGLSHDSLGGNLLAFGDVDGDGLADLGVSGRVRVEATGAIARVFWLLFLNRDGTVRDHASIAAGSTSTRLAAAIGDVDGDGVPELAASTGDGVLIRFLTPQGSVARTTEIPLGFVLQGLAGLGDFDGDGVPDLAVGGDTPAQGPVVQLLSLDPGGNVIAVREILGTSVGAHPDEDQFGTSVVALGDLDANGTTDLAIGAPSNNPLELYTTVWIVLLEPDGSVSSGHRLDPGAVEETFGAATASLGDLNGDGVPDLAAGAPGSGFQGNWPAVYVLFLDGIGELDLDDSTNGFSLRHANPFESLVAIDSSGANFGPAAFDTTPGGPNDPGQDPDLLVDRGNVLILQEDPAQSVEGVFDAPDDSRFGGVLVFDFASPVELYSIDLVDICPDPTQDATVILSDSRGGQRVYLVPSGWTSDVTVEGTGVGTLDLTVLGAQPGHVAVAISSETPGFEPCDVVRLEVELASSGAVDALVYDPHPEVDDEERGSLEILRPRAPRRKSLRR